MTPWWLRAYAYALMVAGGSWASTVLWLAVGHPLRRRLARFARQRRAAGG